MCSSGRRWSSLSRVDALVADSALSAVHAPPQATRRSRALINHQSSDSLVFNPPAPPSDAFAHVAHTRLDGAYRRRRTDTKMSDVYPINLPSAATISAVLHRYHHLRQARPPAVIPAAAFPTPSAQLPPCCPTISRHPRLPARPKNKFPLPPLLSFVQARGVSPPSPPPPLHPNNP